MFNCRDRPASWHHWTSFLESYSQDTILFLKIFGRGSSSTFSFCLEFSLPIEVRIVEMHTCWRARGWWLCTSLPTHGYISEYCISQWKSESIWSGFRSDRSSISDSLFRCSFKEYVAKARLASRPARQLNGPSRNWIPFVLVASNTLPLTAK